MKPYDEGYYYKANNLLILSRYILDTYQVITKHQLFNHLHAKQTASKA